MLPLRDGFKMANVDLYGEACKQICGLINEFRGKNKKFYEGCPIMRASMLTIALTSNPSREYNLSKEDIDDRIDIAGIILYYGYVHKCVLVVLPEGFRYAYSFFLSLLSASASTQLVFRQNGV